ncbi:hypothetical protein SPBR_04376 [Sporothrix brasiliensis 5110]|uniref:Oxidoreductase-like domain-containing protein n=1 Tax=Sporothrix brasiliensis 5110 TaxID=1398154 RepID=A0A0C2F433_9PEZI|nr:uncharacterized protein SPBR_04376 [Sporothrix brasiliensis 5110]KIH93644.1 hypothetical protein SPBR_04376 [Sporothrix brasiliensis 5110]
MKRLLPRSQATLCQRPRPLRATTTTSAALSTADVPTNALSSSSRRHAPPPPATVAPTFDQAQPRGGYYDVLLTSPPPYASARANMPPVTANPTPSQAPASTAPTSAPAGQWKQSEAPATVAARKAAEQKAVKERAALVFGSRLAGPMERANRLAEIRKRSTKIAGVLVPPKPTEPDNCCMSGCVNCVWDRFRDEMEEWAAASTEASRRLQAQEGGVAKAAGGPPTSASPGPGAANYISMDDDGGGSDTNWSLEDAARSASAANKAGWDEALYKNVPVGIREFMKQEKRLKLKHMNEGTVG